jgi:hypothetical protein
MIASEKPRLCHTTRLIIAQPLVTSIKAIESHVLTGAFSPLSAF